jgi:predicted transcriptional regulator
MPLTERQQMIYDLRHSTQPLMSFAEIGQKLELTKGAVERLYRKALARMAGVQERPRGHGRKLEEYDSEKAAEAIERLTDPLSVSVAEIAREVGLNEKTTLMLAKRLEGRYLPLKKQIEDVRTADLLNLVSTRAREILDSIDEGDIAKATLKDKAIAAGIFIDKRQLLSGEPTQILSVEDRRKLDELLPMIVREAKRRGMTIDVDPVTQETHLLNAGEKR